MLTKNKKNYKYSLYIVIRILHKKKTLMSFLVVYLIIFNSNFKLF